MTSLDLAHRLAQALPFKDLPANQLQTVIQAAHHRRVSQDAYFFRQGDLATVFYILIEGEAKLTQLTPDGHQVLMCFVNPGEGFGVISALNSASHPLSAQAVTDCKALAWDEETLTRLMESFPRLAINALQMVSQHHQELQNRYLELATERVERRIAHAVLRLVQQAGQKVEQGILINLPLSRQDLAEMTGTTLYTVSRIISRWEEQGIARTGRKRLLIRRPHDLVAIAEDLLR